MIKKLVFAALATVCVLSFAQISNGSLYFTKKHQKWASFLVVSTTFEDRIRVLGQSTGDSMSILVDRLDSDCGTYFLQLAKMLKKPIETDIGQTEFDAEMRIDNNTVVPIKLLSSAKMGDEALLFYMQTTEDSARIIAEMSRGNGLRIRIDVDPPIFEKFPLHGFREALERASYLCKHKEDQDAPTGPSKSKKYL